MNTLNGLIPCIVSGGSGTRLWPVSRQNMPKPFLRMRDGQSLLQKPFQRAAKLPGVESVLTVTNRDLLFRTLDDYRSVNKAHLPLDLLLEPFGRNTGGGDCCGGAACAGTFRRCRTTAGVAGRPSDPQ